MCNSNENNSQDIILEYTTFDGYSGLILQLHIYKY